MKNSKLSIINCQLSIISVLICVVVSSLSVSAQEFEDAYTAVENMKIGWCLGNTLESNSGDTTNMWIEHWSSRRPSDYETSWGQPVTKASLMKLFKDAGFNTIRIPVTWYPHMEAKFTFDSNNVWWPSKDNLGTKVNATWMKRVHEVVDYVISQGMYCILNVHHDTGAANTAWLVADEQVYEQQHERFESLWKQIAEEFKDYDEHLLFEGYNEMLDSYDSWCFASFATPSKYDSKVATSAYNAINSYAQSFVNAVRSTGGNNAQRNLIVNTYGGCDGNGTWNSHLKDPLKYMELPDDDVEEHIIFEIHTYLDIINLSTAQSTFKNVVSSAKTNLFKKGAPVIIGEWGTTTENAHEKYHDNFLSYARFVVETLKANNMAGIYWMTLSDGTSRSKPEFTYPDLVDAIVKGYYGEGGYTGIDTPSLASHHKASSVQEFKDAMYNLAGERVSADYKGIIIKNGRKYLVH